MADETIASQLVGQLLDAWPVQRWQAHRTVVAVSGGADSTALLLALSMIHRFAGVSPQLVVAHVNHATRADESDEDQRFVEELAVKLRVDLHVTRVPASRWSSATEGFEEAARSVRLDFFRQVAIDVGARYVLTAHTADDVAETVLFRMMRGTGLRGLAAIPRVRSLAEGISLVRPWLGVRRSQILSFLAEEDQPFRTDSSNLSANHLRNRIRHELLPLMNELMPNDVTDAIVRLAQQTQNVVESLGDESLEHPWLSQVGNQWVIDRDGIASFALHSVIEKLRALALSSGWPLRDWDQASWERLAQQCLYAEPTTWTYPGSIRVCVDRYQVTISQSVDA